MSYSQSPDEPIAPIAGAVDDAQRLSSLRRSGLLEDRSGDPAFDRLARLASRLLAAPLSLITVVDADRQVFAGQHGLSEPWAGSRQTPLSHSFCRHVVTSGAPLVINDARQDVRYEDNPAIGALGVIGYLAVPLATPNGRVIGAFCAIDDRPRMWDGGDLTTLADLAAAAMSEIAHRWELARRRESEERLRVLVSEIDHRVKNSLAVTRSLLEMQARTADDAYVREQLEEAAARVSTIAMVHDRLYGHEAGGTIRLDDYLRHLCHDLATSFGVSHECIALEAAPLAVPVDRVVSLGLIVTQLVTAAMKRGTAAVSVSFLADQSGHHVLCVSHAADAVSLSDAGLSTGLGARLMSALSRQFGGETETAEDGSIRLRIPQSALQ